jgi:hypothetical protein
VLDPDQIGEEARRDRADKAQLCFGSVCVSFTPVRSRSPVYTGCPSGLVTDGGERWCAVLQSV